MQYCSDDIDKFLLEFSEAGETDESYTNEDYNSLFGSGDGAKLPARSSSKTSNAALEKLKRDIAREVAKPLKTPMSLTTPIPIITRGAGSSANAGGSGSSSALGLRNHPRMYQIGAAGNLDGDMDKKDITDIAAQLVKSSNDNPFAALPKFAVKIDDDNGLIQLSDKEKGPGSKKRKSSNEVGGDLSLGLGLPGVSVGGDEAGAGTKAAAASRPKKSRRGRGKTSIRF